MKHTFNLSCDVEAESEECGRTMIYQALLDTATGLMFHDKTPHAPSFRMEFQSKLRRKENEQFWESLDWKNKTLLELSAETGISAACIGIKRREIFGAHSPVVKRKNRDRFNNWKTAKVTDEQKAAIDWTLEDAKIGRELGVSRERVRQWRVRAGMPKVYIKSEHKHLVERVKSEWDTLKYLPLDEIVSKLDTTHGKLFYVRHKLGLLKPFTVRKNPWHLFNFELPNVALHEIWGAPLQNIASRRFNEMLCKPKWRTNGKTDREAFAHAYEAEQQKAEQWRANNPQPNKGER